MWISFSTLGRRVDHGDDRCVIGVGRALADEQALGLDAEHDRDDDQQRADHERADGVEDRVAGDHREADAEEGEHEADQSADVLEQHDGQLRRLGVANERHPRLSLAADVIALLDRRPQREGLEHDRDDENRRSAPTPSELVRVDDLLDALVDREQTADREQDDRDDERVDVAFPAVAERVILVGLRLARRPPSSRSS